MLPESRGCIFLFPALKTVNINLRASDSFLLLTNSIANLVMFLILHKVLSAQITGRTEVLSNGWNT
jgi:hypothetical protein